MIAERLGIDPFEIRMKNLLDKGESFSHGDTPIDCDLKAGLKQRRASDRLGCAAEWPTECRIEKKRDRHCYGDERRRRHQQAGERGGDDFQRRQRAACRPGSVEVGQGMRTAFLQVVAEELSVPTDEVRVAALDTHSTPFDKGTNASSATSIMGQAVQKAARDARRQFLEAASAVLKAPAGEIRLEDGTATYGEQKLSFREVMQRHFRDSEGEIWGRGYFKIGKDENVPLGYPSPFWEIGFGAAEVEVDTETGEVKVLRYVSLTDAGKMINPLQCHAQDEGAAVFGLGQALFEDLVYQDGQLVNGSLIDYRLPTFQRRSTDIQNFHHGRRRRSGTIWRQGNGRGRHSPGRAGSGECGVCGRRQTFARRALDAGHRLAGDQQELKRKYNSIS